jgi:hypothetical protein
MRVAMGVELRKWSDMSFRLGRMVLIVTRSAEVIWFAGME